MSDACEKHEQSKNIVIKELFSENRNRQFFLVKKGSYMTLDTVKIWKIGKEIGKIWKNMVDDFKKVIRYFGRENGNLSLK